MKFQCSETLSEAFIMYFFLILNSEFLHLVQFTILFSVNDKMYVDGLILTENV